MADNLLWCAEDKAMVQNAGQEDERNYYRLDGEPYETGYAQVGELYRACLKEHGRCIGYAMMDHTTPGHQGPRSFRVGWVFRRRPTLEEMGGAAVIPPHTVIDTWVTVYTVPPKRVWTPGTYAKVG